MGVINHNTIVATTWSGEEVNHINSWINTLDHRHKSLFVTCNNIFGDTTIIMIPDGSKEGWEESNKCDELRGEFIKVLESRSHEDGSNAWKYVEVSFGECGQSIVRGNNKDMYS